MEITRRHKRHARRLIGLGSGDVIAALGGPLREGPGYRETRLGKRMRTMYFNRIGGVPCEVAMWCCVEALGQQRSYEGYRGVMAIVADMRLHDVGEIREATRWLRMLGQMITDEANGNDVRVVAESLLDGDFARVWQVALWSGNTWKQAHKEALTLRGSDEWEMAAALCRNAPVDDLEELQELSKALNESERSRRGRRQGVR